MYDLITNVILCHIHHISNSDLYVNGHISCEFIEIQVKLNHFTAIMCILVHVVICVKDIQIFHDLRYNV